MKKYNKAIQTKTASVEKKKRIAILFLYIGAAAIILSGVTFTIISAVNDVSIAVMNTPVHGAVFGIVVAFLGIRYFLSVRKLQAEVYKASAEFSWRNFKKDKSRRSMS